MKRYYLDHNATTPLHPAVAAAMAPWQEGLIGNASSLHAEGRRARAAVDASRDQVAQWLGAKPHEIIFTGGGTESCNLAVQGMALAAHEAGRAARIITSAGEHHAVLHACDALERHHGFQVARLPLTHEGLVETELLREALKEDAALVSIMTANNETGVCQSLEALGPLVAERGVVFHTDAVQSAGKEWLDVQGWNVTALSLTAHKFGGPPGVGVLYLKAGVAMRRLMEGGAHENERRPGTENVAAIVGLAEAAAQAEATREDEVTRQFTQIETLWQGLKSLGEIHRHGHTEQRLPNTLNVRIGGVDPEEVLMGLDLAGLAVSSGSACLVGSVQASHVLQAMGVESEGATVRFSIGAGLRDEDLAEIVSRVRSVVEQQRVSRASL